MSGFSGQIGSLFPLLDEKGFPRYESRLWFRIPLFEYAYAIPELIYTDKDGVQYELDRHFQTDGGSIPPRS